MTRRMTKLVPLAIVIILHTTHAFVEPFPMIDHCLLGSSRSGSVRVDRNVFVWRVSKNDRDNGRATSVTSTNVSPSKWFSFPSTRFSLAPPSNERTTNRNKNSNGNRQRQRQRSRQRQQRQQQRRISTSELLDRLVPISVQGGGSLRTCALDEGSVDRVTVFVTSPGDRPVSAHVEIWEGPVNVPQQMSVFLSEGTRHPFRCTVECPGSNCPASTVAIRNVGPMECPLDAGMEIDVTGQFDPPGDVLVEEATTTEEGSSWWRTLQGGGAVVTQPIPSSVSSIHVALQTDGRPLEALIELLQGPNNIKQTVHVSSNDGRARPFYLVIETPSDTYNHNDCVLRIVNTAPVTFPLFAAVAPFLVDQNEPNSNPNRMERMIWR